MSDSYLPVQQKTTVPNEINISGPNPNSERGGKNGILISFLLICFVTMGVMGYFLWQQNEQITVLRKEVSELKSVTQLEEAQPSLDVMNEEEKNGEVAKPHEGKYINDTFGFTLDIPESYTLTDKLQLDNNEWSPNNSLTLIDNSHPLKPRMTVALDYDGYGPFFPLEVWDIRFDLPSNSMKVVDKRLNDAKEVRENIEELENVSIDTSFLDYIFIEEKRILRFGLGYHGLERNDEIEADFMSLIESFELIK